MLKHFLLTLHTMKMRGNPADWSKCNPLQATLNVQRTRFVLPNKHIASGRIQLTGTDIKEPAAKLQ